MSDAVIASSPVKAAPKTKKPSKPKVPAAHPQYKEMIVAAIGALKERSGSSRIAILKYIQANYKVTESANVHLKLALKAQVKAGVLKQSKGTGAAGSFKLGEKKAVSPKKKPAKKPAAKKSPKKAKKAKSPAKKAAKKPKSPAKAKSPAKKAAAKKPKSPAKKAVAAKAKSPAKKAAAPKKSAAKNPAAKKPVAKKAAA